MVNETDSHNRPEGALRLEGVFYHLSKERQAYTYLTLHIASPGSEVDTWHTEGDMRRGRLLLFRGRNRDTTTIDPREYGLVVGAPGVYNRNLRSFVFADLIKAHAYARQVPDIDSELLRDFYSGDADQRSWSHMDSDGRYLTFSELREKWRREADELQRQVLEPLGLTEEQIRQIAREEAQRVLQRAAAFAGDDRGLEAPATGG